MVEARQRTTSKERQGKDCFMGAHEAKVAYALHSRYMRFHGLRQNNMSVKDYTEKFNNISAYVGLLKTTEQLTACYLAGLRVAICDELIVGQIVTLENVY